MMKKLLIVILILLLAAGGFGAYYYFSGKANERDIEDIPQEVRDVLEIIPVSNICEILNSVFVQK